MGLPVSIFWANTIDEWVILVDNDCPNVVGEEWEWYPLERLKSVPLHLLQIQEAPLHGNPALIFANE
jgi:hypothetical protein